MLAPIYYFEEYSNTSILIKSQFHSMFSDTEKYLRIYVLEAVSVPSCNNKTKQHAQGLVAWVVLK